MRNRLIAAVTFVLAASTAFGQTPAPASGYLLPPRVIVDILEAPQPPQVELSPSKDVVVLLQRASMPSIAELSQPVLRLAGLRINPKTNGQHRSGAAVYPRYSSFSIKTIADGTERKVTLPPSPSLAWIGFSPDGKRFAFTQHRDNGIELWIADTATGQAKAISAAQLNAALGTPCEWVGTGGSLLCEFVPANRGPAP